MGNLQFFLETAMKLILLIPVALVSGAMECPANRCAKLIERSNGNICDETLFPFLSRKCKNACECEDKNDWCSTYFTLSGVDMCKLDYFTDPNGMYGCQKTCCLC